MQLKYFIHGYLLKAGRRVCTCVCGVDSFGTVWNMRGGLDYMRSVEVYPCLRYRSIELLQADEASLYKGGSFRGEPELLFEACEPVPVTI